MQLSVRPFVPRDFESIVDYFLKGEEAFLVGMGVDVKKLPSRDQWLRILDEEFTKPPEEKKFFYMIWMRDGENIGHCNINKIVYGEEAYLHLHMWKPDSRKKGAGRQLVEMSLPYFFDRFKLKKLFCEPYAKNEAPNRTLKKLGFTFIKSYDTIPGWISFHQPVNTWCLDAHTFRSKAMQSSLPMNQEIEVFDFQPEHQPWFEKLNRDWIEKYFWMEAIDFEVLQKPEQHIIDHGGKILMAQYNKEIAGTVALKYVETGIYEFTKMAVDEKFQGKKIGQALADAAIAKAKSLGADKIILYSNTKLEPAIALYRKIGFREIPVDGPYKRSNIKMELLLNQQ